MITKKEQTIAQMVYRECLAIGENESVLIVTDEKKEVEALIFYETAKAFTKTVRLMRVSGMTENGQEPTTAIRRALCSFDISLLVTAYSLSHTKARLAASAKGARIISMPGISRNMIRRTLAVDYPTQSTLTKKFQTLLTEGSTIHIVSGAGTDVTFSMAGREAIADTGYCKEAGNFINLPAGEAFIAPIEHSAQGTIVFDGAIASIRLDAPITIILINGVIQTVRGGSGARLFEKRLQMAGPKARIICEFGIGTNTKAHISQEILEAEKVIGSCHIAFGRNSTFGGTNDVAFHTDGLILKPTITIDNRCIMKEATVINIL